VENLERMSVKLSTPASRPPSTIQARCTRASTTLQIASPSVVSGVTVTCTEIFFPALFSQKVKTGNSSYIREGEGM